MFFSCFFCCSEFAAAEAVSFFIGQYEEGCLEIKLDRKKKTATVRLAHTAHEYGQRHSLYYYLLRKSQDILRKKGFRRLELDFVDLGRRLPSLLGYKAKGPTVLSLDLTKQPSEKEKKYWRGHYSKHRIRRTRP